MGSPVAGLFVVLIAAAWVGTPRPRPRAALAMGAAAALTGIVLVGAFPEGGDEPFVGSASGPRSRPPGWRWRSHATARARCAPAGALRPAARRRVRGPQPARRQRRAPGRAARRAAGRGAAVPDRRRLLAFAGRPARLLDPVPAGPRLDQRRGRPRDRGRRYYAPLLAELASATRRPARASRSRSPRATGRRCTWPRTCRWPAAGSASSTAATTGCSTRATADPGALPRMARRDRGALGGAARRQARPLGARRGAAHPRAAGLPARGLALAALAPLRRAATRAARRRRPGRDCFTTRGGLVRCAGRRTGRSLDGRGCVAARRTATGPAWSHDPAGDGARRRSASARCGAPSA